MANYTETELANVPAQELIEIILELQSAKIELKVEAEMARSEQKDAEERAEDLQDELDGFTEVDLGLDTLQYKFEKGNLQLVQKLEQFLERKLNTVPHAEIFK